MARAFGFNPEAFATVYNEFSPYDVESFIEDIMPNIDIPIVSVGSGKAYVERSIYDKREIRRIVTVDPDASQGFNSRGMPEEWLSAALLDEEVLISYALGIGAVGVKQSFKPEYPTVDDLLAEEPELKGRCYLMMVKPYIDDTTWDYEAILKLRPIKVFIMFQSSGEDGGKKLHHFLGYIGAPSEKSENPNLHKKEVTPQILEDLEYRGVDLDLIKEYKVLKTQTEVTKVDYEYNPLGSDKEFALVGLRRVNADAMEYEKNYSFEDLISQYDTSWDGTKHLIKLVDTNDEIRRLLYYGIGLDKYLRRLDGSGSGSGSGVPAEQAPEAAPAAAAGSGSAIDQNGGGNNVLIWLYNILFKYRD